MDVAPYKLFCSDSVKHKTGYERLGILISSIESNTQSLILFNGVPGSRC
jgi:hypothetical protein